jgi:hypothetical protein
VIRSALQLAFPIVFVGLGVLVVLLATPLDAWLVLEWYVVYVVLILLVALVRATAGSLGISAFELALRRRRDRLPRPESLERLESQVHLATATAADYHFKLRPLVAEVAAVRLRDRLGVDPGRQPGRAKQILGAEAWELARSDLDPPADRHGPGVPLAELTRAVAAIERIDG